MSTLYFSVNNFSGIVLYRVTGGLFYNFQTKPLIWWPGWIYTMKPYLSCHGDLPIS